MTPQKFREDQHFLSKGYLKRWASGDGRVWMYRLLVSNANVPSWSRQPPARVAYQQHLYSRVLSGELSDDFEHWMGEEVEGPVDLVLTKIERERTLAPADWQVLLRFYAASQARTPAYFLRKLPHWEKTLQGEIEKALRSTVEKLESQAVDGQGTEFKPGQEFGGIELPMRVRVNREAGIIEAEVAACRTLWLAEIKRLATITAPKILTQHRWSILRPPDGRRWMTSDDPAVGVSLSFDGSVLRMGTGWMVPNTVLLMPLDPYHLLYTVVGQRTRLKYTTMDPSSAELIQRCLVLRAHRLVFAVEPDELASTLRPRVVGGC